MSLYSEHAFRDKLRKLTETQDSIQTLSQWIIYHKARCVQSVDIWKQEIYKDSTPQRKLLLLYLANDILQEGRRKGTEFVQAFSKILPDAVGDVWRSSPPPVRDKIVRLLKVWEERKVYAKNFVDGIVASCSEVKPKPPQTADKKMPLRQEIIDVSEAPQPPIASEGSSEVNLSDPETLETKFRENLTKKANPSANIEQTIKILQKVQESLPSLSSLEPRVIEILPHCLQFQPEAAVGIRNGDPATIHSLQHLLECNNETLKEYKALLEADIDTCARVVAVLTTLLHHVRTRSTQNTESLLLLSHVIEANRVLQLKVEQRKQSLTNGQGELILPIEPAQPPPSSVTSLETDELEEFFLPLSQTKKRPAGSINLTEYKRRKIEEFGGGRPAVNPNTTNTINTNNINTNSQYVRNSELQTNTQSKISAHFPAHISNTTMTQSPTIKNDTQPFSEIDSIPESLQDFL